jgi:protein SPA2
MNELNDLSRQNDELITSKDSDLILIRDLGNQLKEYKRKYEQAKTELRSVKGKNITLAVHPHLIICHFFLSSFISHFSTFPSNAQI